MKLDEILSEEESSDLPKSVIKSFNSTATAQRTMPESKMVAITRKYDAAFLKHNLEHIGDLTHRFGEVGKYGKVVSDIDKKIADGIKSLSNIKPNLLEFKEQMTAQADSKGIDPSQWMQSFASECEEYSALHSQIPVYNEVQLLSKKAAVALGGMQFEECLEHLNVLWSYCGSREQLDDKAREYKMGSDGYPIRMG